jgi:hypothetical protein
MSGLTSLSTSGPFFDVFSDSVRAEAAFLDSVSHYQRDRAHDLSEEIAQRGDMARVRQQEEVLHQLVVTYDRLRHAQHEAHVKIVTIERKVHDAKWLMMGESLWPALISRCWNGIQWLMMQADPESLEKIYAMEVSADTGDKMNVAAYIAGCSLRRTMPRRGSSQMLAVLSAIGLLAADAKKRADEIRAMQKELEAGVFSIFDPLKIDSLDTATALKAAQKGG